MGYLARYGSRLKTETENCVFYNGSVKAFLEKPENGTVFEVQIAIMVGPETGGHGTIRYGMVRYVTVRLGTVRYGTVRYG